MQSPTDLHLRPISLSRHCQYFLVLIESGLVAKTLTVGMGWLAPFLWPQASELHPVTKMTKLVPSLPSRHSASMTLHEGTRILLSCYSSMESTALFWDARFCVVLKTAGRVRYMEICHREWNRQPRSAANKSIVVLIVVQDFHFKNVNRLLHSFKKLWATAFLPINRRD